MANFIPPVNGASQGNYFLAKVPKIAVFEAKTGYTWTKDWLFGPLPRPYRPPVEKTKKFGI